MYTFQFQTEQCSEIDHEVFSECGNNICQNTCEAPQKSLVCRGTCISGCVCQEGYLRNSQGACVLPAECDSCKENEEFTECGNHGCLNTCLNPNLITVCLPVPGCFPGCICSPGFLRNPLGQCVPESECQCGENEVYSESGKTICENTCEEPRKITYCKAKSEAGCGCIEGYLKNSTNVCVLPENCDGGCDGDVNAYFDKCGDPCPRTCNNYKKGEMVCACIQAGGCKCKKGYVRDINKKCVLPSKCPQCGPNEFFDCGSACDTTCATLGDVCPIVNIKCNEMCYCVGGYARDKNNVCIPIKQCPPKFTCARNQTYDACPYTCPPEETCESHLSGIAFSCAEEPEPRTCVPKCKCSAGFLRKVNGGDCIKPNQCCNDPNAEIVSCPNPCPGGTCIAPAFANCKAPCKIRGCQCKSGYVKDANGKCILLSKCPKLCTKPNEKFYSCKPCVPSCTDKNPVCVAACIEGCACQPGYVRKSDSDSTCILEKNCPKLCTKPNEKYYTCKPCVPSCTNKNPMCAAACLEGCACQPGYVRKSDSDSTCILEKNCPPVCTRQNEQYYDCKPCTQLCRDVSPPCLEICIPGCDCKPGFFKNTDNGNLCVELDDCTCGQNEVFRGCPARCPPEPSCAAMFRVDQEPCTNRSSAACYHDCACKPNYVRNDLKLCVLPQKCCTDPNSELVSKPSCCPGGTCANPKFNNFCRMACPEKGCQCKKGFLKISDENKKCIPVKDCPKYP